MHHPTFAVQIGVSHTDHVPEGMIAFLCERFAGRAGFFIETVEIPEPLEPVNDALYGPANGDPVVEESEVHYCCRGGRPYASRVVDRPMRKTRHLTVIAGPHEEGPDKWDCLLYTAFGGKVTPREASDPDLPEEGRAASVAFWSQHALALG